MPYLCSMGFNELPFFVETAVDNSDKCCVIAFKPLLSHTAVMRSHTQYSGTGTTLALMTVPTEKTNAHGNNLWKVRESEKAAMLVQSIVTMLLCSPPPKWGDINQCRNPFICQSVCLSMCLAKTSFRLKKFMSSIR